MKKKFLAFCTLLVAFFCLALFACSEVIQTVKEGPETGVYYFNATTSEYLITLNNGVNFSLFVDGEVKSGVYTLEGEALTFKFTKSDEEIDATLRNNVISLTYLDVPMRFLKKVTYTVSFNSNGGTNVDSIPVTNGQPIMEKPDDPTRTGHTLLGWYTDPEFNHPFAFGYQPVTSNLMLYAHWIETAENEDVFTVSFDLNYEGSPQNPLDKQTISGRIGDYIIPTRDGHEFLGWWVSMYNDPNMLAYPLSSNTIFNENTTLYAQWRANGAAAYPIVKVDSTAVRWEAISGVTSYSYEITGPQGTTPITGSTGSTFVSVPFISKDAGDYVIKVTANSLTTTRYYINKALPKVSLFRIVEPSILLFNSVGAENYKLTITCGDTMHNHNLINNGQSTYYNFANCPMREGGIVFKVIAESAGYVSSESEEFIYERVLSEISGFYLDAETQTLWWDAVDNASGYTVSVTCGDSSHAHVVNIGNKTSYSLKECSPRVGGIEVSVYATREGYNSAPPSVYTFYKTNLASVRQLRVEGTTIIFDAVDGASSYDVEINGVVYSSDTYLFDLVENEIDLSLEDEFTIRVMAKGATNSLWSDPVVITKHLNELNYSNNTLSWNYCIGAEKFQIRINGNNLPETVYNYTEITLIAAGRNEIEVRSFQDGVYSDWIKIAVNAHVVSFNSSAGTAVPDQYCAEGDRIILPDTTRIGYDLAGWYTLAGNRFLDSTLNEANDIILTAYWSPLQYTVTYNDGENDQTLDVTFGQDFFIAPPASDAANFIGWFASVDGTEFRLTDETGNSVIGWYIAQNVTAYPKTEQLLTFVSANEGTEWSVKAGPNIDLVQSVVIPDTYQDLPVTRLELLAFQNCTSLTSITIGKNINYIPTDAIDGCTNLSEIKVDPANTRFSSQGGVFFESISIEILDEDDETVLETVTGLELKLYPLSGAAIYEIPQEVISIGVNAFLNRLNLVEITIPKNTIILSAHAFNGCRNLTTVNFEDDSALTILGGSAFANCVRLTDITLPDGITSIGESTFSGCQFTQIVLPSSLTEIGSYAFQNCVNLEEIVFPATLEHIGTRAFQGCTGLKEVEFAEDGTADLVIDANAFTSCTDLTKVVFPDNLVKLGVHIFNACTSLAEVHFGAGVEFIGGTTSAAPFAVSVFFNCTSTTTITVSESNPYFTVIGGVLALKIIDNDTVVGYDLLYSPRQLAGDYTVPDDVRNILASAFADCSMLEDLFIPASVENIASDAFNGAGITSITFTGTSSKPIKELTIGAGAVGFSGAFFNCHNLTTVIVESGSKIAKIGNSAFYGCKNLETVELRTGSVVLAIESNTFAYCPKLDTVILNANTTETLAIGSSAFSSCAALEDITFKTGGAYTFGTSIFAGSGLTSITIPASISSIPNYAFDKCVNLASVNFESGINLTSIGTYAFDGCQSLESIEILGTVTSIGSYAFRDCSSLAEIDFREGTAALNLSSYAFQRVGVTSVIIPKRMTLNSSSTYMFNECVNLTTVTFEAGNTSTMISDNMFRGSGLTSIEIPASITSINSSAFYGCKDLATVTFAVRDTLKTIGSSAFNGCTSLTVMNLPNSVTSIGDSSFQNCLGLTAINLDELSGGENPVYGNSTYHTIDGVLFNAAETTLVTFPAGKQAATYTIPNGVTTLAQYSFHGTNNIGSLVFPSTGFTTVNAYAFWLSGITRVTLPSTVRTVGNGAFQYCPNLEYLSIPNGVTSLGTGVVRNCPKLETFTFPTGISTLGGHFFRESGLKSILIPKDVVTIDTSAFEGCTELELVEFETGSKLETINGTAFKNCSKLENITFPASLKSIKASFEGCTNLKTISFAPGSKLESIDENAFLNSGLIQVTLPAGFTNIKISAFNGCANLTSIIVSSASTAYKSIDGVLFNKAGTVLLYYPADKVGPYTIPEGVTRIGNNAFKGARGLTDIIIPGSLKSVVAYDTKEIILHGIGENAFQDCINLRTVTFQNGTDGFSIGKNAFLNCTSLESIIIPSRVQNFGYSTTVGGTVTTVHGIGDTAFKGSGLQTLIFEDGGSETLTFGASAFIDCTSLISVTLPQRLTALSQSAFENCSNLTTINLPLSLTTINNYAFRNCSSITELYIHIHMGTIGESVFTGWTEEQTVYIQGRYSKLSTWHYSWAYNGNPTFVYLGY